MPYVIGGVHFDIDLFASRLLILILRSLNMSYGDLTLEHSKLMLFSWTGNLIIFMPSHPLVSLLTACRRSNKTSQQSSSLLHSGQHNPGLRFY